MSCPSCKGSGRCSDIRCWCLSDICATCRGKGKIEPPVASKPQEDQEIEADLRQEAATEDAPGAEQPASASPQTECGGCYRCDDERRIEQGRGNDDLLAGYADDDDDDDSWGTSEEHGENEWHQVVVTQLCVHRTPNESFVMQLMRRQAADGFQGEPVEIAPEGEGQACTSTVPHGPHWDCFGVQS